jgi:L,D-transpeptidase-like protein
VKLAALLAAAALVHPTLLTHGTVTRWAYVVYPVRARVAPDPRARALTIVQPVTPEGAQNLVVALARDGGWVRVRLPILPNGSTGWVPRNALAEFHTVHTRLVIDRSRFTAVLYRDGRMIFRTDVGVGKEGSPTPDGQFYVREKLDGFGEAFYGPVAFGTNARSAVLTDWPGGGYIGIHGTDDPGILPGRVSHGCVRLRNDAILRLASLMPLGTPVSVVG